MGLGPVQSLEEWRLKGTCDQKSPKLGLTFCCCYLEILDHYIFIHLVQWGDERCWGRRYVKYACGQSFPSSLAYSTHHAPWAQDAYGHRVSLKTGCPWAQDAKTLDALEHREPCEHRIQWPEGAHEHRILWAQGAISTGYPWLDGAWEISETQGGDEVSTLHLGLSEGRLWQSW